MVTWVPGMAPFGWKLTTYGGGTVNSAVLLLTPPTVTTAGPVADVTGTLAMICVLLQLETEAGWPLKLSTLVPCDAPKAVPFIVTCVPTGPLVGEMLEIVWL